jgi:hypothetical protein
VQFSATRNAAGLPNINVLQGVNPNSFRRSNADPGTTAGPPANGNILWQ